MSWNDFQILDLNYPVQSTEAAENSSLLLEWIADNSFLESEIFESKLEISGQIFFRFSINAVDTDGSKYHGIGRSKNRLQAASIAAGEVIERYSAKNVFKSTMPFYAKHLINVSNTQITVLPAEVATTLPLNGLRSSNGWAVHFSLKTSIENSIIESLERHTLLYSYLHSGWDGFYSDSTVPFKDHQLTPYISRFSFGGFSAGLVTTEGKEFPGQTFGYLCEKAGEINGTKKWLSAFFESFGQWESLVIDNQMSESKNILSKYQRHFLTASRARQTSGSLPDELINVSDINANVLVLDLKKALSLPTPLFATFSFGGNLIPLFFKQKLSADEMKSLEHTLQSWNLSTLLPEFHPIL